MHDLGVSHFSDPEMHYQMAYTLHKAFKFLRINFTVDYLLLSCISVTFLQQSNGNIS